MSTHDTFKQFLAAFAEAAGIDPVDADAQWSGFSRDLPDCDRAAIESGGEASGREMGEDFRTVYA